MQVCCKQKKLMQNLLRKGFERQHILNVLHFIDEYVHFENLEFQVIFDSEIDVALKIGKSISTYELVLRPRRAGARKIKKQARIEGLEEGRQEGIEMAIERLLRKQFSVEMVSEILEVDQERVRIIQERLLAADRN